MKRNTAEAIRIEDEFDAINGLERAKRAKTSQSGYDIGWEGTISCKISHMMPRDRALECRAA